MTGREEDRPLRRSVLLVLACHAVYETANMMQAVRTVAMAVAVSVQPEEVRIGLVVVAAS